MNIREMTQADMEDLRYIHHRMQIGYPFPDFGPLYAIRRAASNGTGHIVGAAAVKVVGEAFLWLAPDASDMKKLEAIADLSVECGQACREIGLEEVSAWIPPKVGRKFGPVLSNLGWQKSPWRSWTRRIR